MADPTLSKKRYVPLAEAARISGYTHEYIDRLCRIGKIPCRLMGEKTIVELDALLSQTGTILLGGEHIGFIEIDDNSPYPLIAPAGEVNTTPSRVEEKSESRFGRIAVVGETIHAEDGDGVAQAMNIPIAPVLAGQSGEKFPSNALPFFSSVRKGEKSGGIHIAVSTGEVSTLTPLPPVKDHQSIHLAISGSETEKPKISSLKGISVMPRGVPPGFIPAITPPLTSQSAVSTPAFVGGNTGSAPQHDHDLMGYSSKLPMLFQPAALARKALIAVFALGLFVAPSALGVGNALNDVLIDFGGALHSGARMTMAAVGLIDPRRDMAKFPNLEETSQLLSAVGASANTQASNNGIVIVPSTGNQASDQAIKDAVQKTFSDPVQVIPDGKDGQSGMIRPVFQKNNSAGYIYMMVPVRN